MLSLQKNNFFSLFTPQFFIQKFISILHVKWTAMNMGKSGWKLEVLSEHMCIFVSVYISKFFSFHKEMGNWNFWKAETSSHFQIFPNSLKSLKIEIFVHLPSYLVKWRGWSFSSMTNMRHQRSQFMIKLAIFKKKC